MRFFIRGLSAYIFFLLANPMGVFVQVAHAQDVHIDGNAGRFPLRYIDPSVYDASKENWAIAQDSSGLLYFGNSQGVLIHDGQGWEFLDVETELVRSLIAGPGDRVFFGGYGNLGFIEKDNSGQFYPVSLKEYIPESFRDFTDVWEIGLFKGNVVFMADAYLFVWDGQKMQVWHPDEAFYDIATMADHVVIIEPNKMWVLDAVDSLKAVELKGYPDKVRGIIPSGEEELLLFSMDQLYKCTFRLPLSVSCFLFETEVDDLMKRERVFTVLGSSNGNVLVGFDGAGLAQLSQNGELLKYFDEKSGLLNLEVMRIFEDRENAVWLALYDGIARLEPDSPWSTFGKNVGLQSSVIDITYWRGHMIVSTMLGLFEYVPEKNGMEGRFERLFDSDEYYNCWNFEEIEGILHVGCDGGLLRIEIGNENRARVQNVWEEWVWSIQSSPGDSSVFFMGGRRELLKARLVEGVVKPIYRQEMEGEVLGLRVAPSQDQGYITQVWAIMMDKTLYKIRIPGDEREWDINKIGAGSGLEGEVESSLIYDDLLLVGSDAGLFKTEFGGSEKTVFEKVDLGEGQDARILGVDHEKKVWLYSEKAVTTLERNPRGELVRSLQQPATHTVELQHPMVFYQDGEGVFWIGHGRGLARFTQSGLELNKMIPTLVLRSVTEIASDSMSMPVDLDRSELSSIPFKRANLRFEFAAQIYDFPEKTQYRVWLEGLQPAWQPWSAEHFKEFTNLREGHYTFHVQAKHVSGAVSDVSSVSFNVLPPWYRETWAYLLWTLSIGIILTGLVSGTSRYMTRVLKRRNLALESTVASRTTDLKEKKVALEDANEELHMMNANLLRTNRVLVEQGEQLREALEANKEILGVTAHELKNPLGGIIGLADMVIDDAKEGPQAAYESVGDNIVLLKEEAERMLQIITSLLDKHRQGESIELKKETVILGDIISSVLRWNKRQAEEKDIALHYDAESMYIVEVDIVSIQRAFDNFVSNAIKYSPEGSNVWVEIRDESISEQHVIRVLVKDEGPGLSEEDIKKAFRKMQRLSARPTGGEHSTGLGLYIAKKLVEAHGGEVGVESTHGAGASFWFTLPVFFDVDQDPEQGVIDRAQIKISGIGNLE